MILSPRRRGEPLAALVLVMVGWVGIRAVAWDRALSLEVQPPAAAVPDLGSLSSVDAALTPYLPLRLLPGKVATSRHDRAGLMAAPQQQMRFAGVAAPTSAVLQLLPAVPSGKPAEKAPAPASDGVMLRSAAAASEQQAPSRVGTAILPLPPMGIDPRGPRPAAPLPRWSGDGWLLLRRGTGSIAPGPLAGTYGASQAGAVIRYRMDPASPHRPAAYLRATAALNGSREQEAALGLSARPLPRMPLVAMAEARILREGQGVRVRPAVAVVSELPPQRLPLGFTGEAYVQAGYIGGRGATGFVDGLVRAERPVASAAGFDLRAGGGAWGAKQRGAQRLDIGPVASVRFRLGSGTSVRLQADWRFRIGGDARPGSGPALTLSAGF